MNPASNALVACAWVGQRVPTLTDAAVATRLPREVALWTPRSVTQTRERYFVQITPYSGVPDVDIPVRHPIVQVDVWAAMLDAAGNITNKPPVGLANLVAERIRIATEDGALYSRPVETKTGYENAIVLSAYPISEPFEIPDDQSGYARITFDLALDWARVPPTI